MYSKLLFSPQRNRGFAIRKPLNGWRTYAWRTTLLGFPQWVRHTSTVSQALNTSFSSPSVLTSAEYDIEVPTRPLHSSTSLRTLHLPNVREMHELCQQAVQRVDPEASLYLFGSTVAYGFHEKGSDVDFVALRKADMEDAKAADVFSDAKKKEERTFLQAMYVALDLPGSHFTFQLKTSSRFPVLRIFGHSDVSIDITSFRRDSVRCSHLMRSYLFQSSIARNLCYLVKCWARECGLQHISSTKKHLNSQTSSSCDSSLHCFKSHALMLMTLHFLLRRGVIKYLDPLAIDVRSIEPLPSLPFSPEEALRLQRGSQAKSVASLLMADPRLKEFFCGWLRFYQSEFDPLKEVIGVEWPCAAFQQARIGYPRLPREPPVLEEASLSKALSHFTPLPSLPRSNAPQWSGDAWCILDPIAKGVNLGAEMTEEGVRWLREKVLPRSIEVYSRL